MNDASEGWSDSLRQLTRTMIKDPHNYALRKGQLYMKNYDGRSGAVSIRDLDDGIIRIAEANGGAITVFQSVDDLVASGWAVD